jgi:hypothetical protein
MNMEPRQDSTLSREVFNAHMVAMQSTLNRIEATCHRLADFQREQNGKVNMNIRDIAVLDERLDNATETWKQRAAPYLGGTALAAIVAEVIYRVVQNVP